MERKEIIEELKKFFKLEDLVCSHVATNGETGWQFFSTEILHTLLVVRRDILQVPIIINQPQSGISQRGLRCNLCPIVQQKTKANKAYLSAHVLGNAYDLIPQGISAEFARTKIKANEAKLPYPIRLESDVTWVHIDTYDKMNGQKVNYFSV